MNGEKNIPILSNVKIIDGKYTGKIGVVTATYKLQGIFKKDLQRYNIAIVNEEITDTSNCSTETIINVKLSQIQLINKENNLDNIIEEMKLFIQKGKEKGYHLKDTIIEESKKGDIENILLKEAHCFKSYGKKFFNRLKDAGNVLINGK